MPKSDLATVLEEMCAPAMHGKSGVLMLPKRLTLEGEQADALIALVREGPLCLGCRRSTGLGDKHTDGCTFAAFRRAIMGDEKP